MEVYGEIFIVENALIGGVALYVTGGVLRIGFGDPRRRIRLVFGSLMCGVFSFVIFIRVAVPLMILLEIAFSFFVCMTVFGRRILWKKAVAFILTTYFMGGITMALLLVTGNNGFYTATGIYTGDMKAGFLAVFIGFSVFTLKQIIRTVGKRKFYDEHVMPVKIFIGGFSEEVKGFFDTGNALKDPISGKAVAVASEELWRKLMASEKVTEERTCLIPYESIGKKGLLTAVRTDYMNIDGRRFGGSIIAKGDDNFSIDNDEGCSLLLSKYMK